MSEVAERAVTVRRRGHRPSLLTPAVMETLRAELEKGASMSTAARVAGLPPNTLAKWMLRGRGRMAPERKATPEFVAFVEMVENAKANLRSTLGRVVIEGAAKNPELALKLLERFDPEQWGPRAIEPPEPEEDEGLPRLSPALAQPPQEDGPDEDESSSESPDGAVTLRERTLTIPATRIDEFARMLRGERKERNGDGDDDDLAGFREGTDLPKP